MWLSSIFDILFKFLYSDWLIKNGTFIREEIKYRLNRLVAVGDKSK